MSFALPDGLAASKVIAVHLNYRSRAAQRGRTPAHPSYFLKPPSSLTGDGEVVRPAGVELLAFEGEIALVIGSRARGLAVEEAAAAIGWVAPADDFGAQDYRWIDRGSNLIAKGRDGYTPVGPFAAASAVDLGALRIRTRVNGELAQDDVSANLIFSFAELVADLSGFMTLEPGDVILTGTPAGATVVAPGDEVVVELEGVGEVRSRIAEAPARDPAAAAGPGAPPRARPADRAMALGVNGERPVTLSDRAERALRRVSVATLTAQLTRRGISNTFLAGLAPARPQLRMVGYARTLRYGAAREDTRERTRGHDAQKAMVESISPGDVLMIEARGVRDAGTIGDILAARVLARGGAGIVTDGGVRDSPGVAELDIPSYSAAAAASSLWLRHQPLDADLAITCAGVLVEPGDVVVGDAEGAIVLPAAMAEEIAHDALEQESREAFALERVRAGEATPGLYPLSDARRPEYEAWRAAHETEEETP
jgi:5-oxopent-3-ene-1,2,5-tricarboxylate decarboxylase / 2-hydroxyhepta-2,4-diene-1,7-dioate isomerase